jgi:hypothetical protein
MLSRPSGPQFATLYQAIGRGLVPDDAPKKKIIVKKLRRPGKRPSRASRDPYAVSFPLGDGGYPTVTT